MSESIVVYRSRFEQQQDEYAMEHPEVIAAVNLIIFVPVLIFIAAIFCKVIFNFGFKPFKKKNW